MSLEVGFNKQFVLFINCIVLLILGIIHFGGLNPFAFVVAIAVIITALFGMFGAYTKNKTLLFIFMIGCAIIAVLVIISGIVVLIGGLFWIAIIDALILAFLLVCIWLSGQVRGGYRF